MFKYYNMNQVVLPLDLEIKLKENDIAIAIHDLVESIPDEAFDEFLRQTGRPAYHPRMMLKIILCGYTQSAFSGRKIEALLGDSIRMMWLAQGDEPSYRTINRFRSNPLIENLLRECFVQFRNQLVEKELIEEEAIFIDGTKIEANANKFTFVWRKSVEKYSNKLIEKSNQLYNELLEKEIIPAMELENEEELSVEEMKEIVEKLDEKIGEYDEKIETCEVGSERKKIRSERKLPKQARKQLIDFITRKQKYQSDMELFGERNSYSKTDPDATFMRMKDDYMKNGQRKAGYNVQLATEGQYALAYDVFPNPTDTRTLIPFLNTIEESFFKLPDYIVADAGYGSEQNYEDIIQKRNRTPLITYNQYRKEKKKKHKNNAFHVDNWEYNEEEDFYQCPNGRNVSFRYYSKRKDRYGFTREVKVYECEDCLGCPLRHLCTKAKEGNNRKIYINEKWESQKEYVRTKLSDEKTGEIYGKRKIDVEPVFGFLKANLGFTRFSVRGKEKVKNELGFAFMAVNLRKYTAMNIVQTHEYRNNPKKNGSNHLFLVIGTIFHFFWLVMSQPQLIRRYLQAGIMEDGLACPNTEGTPQGGPLSPLLSNIVLDELDKELEKRGLHFVRYADDCNIYVRSKRAGLRIMNTITKFIEEKLKLKVNGDKSAVDRPWRRKFLGFSFTIQKETPKIRVSKESVKRFKQRVRELTSRRKSVAMDRRMEKLNRFLIGWLGYYQLAETPSLFKKLDAWIRRRLRMIRWKEWKKVQTRYHNLIRYGIKKGKAWEWANTRKGYWRIAKSPILHKALDDQYWSGQGLKSLFSRYQTLRWT